MVETQTNQQQESCPRSNWHKGKRPMLKMYMYPGLVYQLWGSKDLQPRISGPGELWEKKISPKFSDFCPLNWGKCF